MQKITNMLYSILNVFRRSIIIFYLIVSNSLINAQIGIGTTTPDPSSVLDVSSTSKGLLIPRLADHTLISNPAEGLQVYNTSTKAIMLYDGNEWKKISDGELPENPEIGAMIYWDGTNWQALDGGVDNASLVYEAGKPKWITPLEIGEFHEGGIVFWVDPENPFKGKTVSMVDMIDRAWGCIGDEIQAYSPIGLENTNTILEECSFVNIAARKCSDLVDQEYADWYLPSIEELGEIFAHKSILNTEIIEQEGNTISDDDKWSSTAAPNNFNAARMMNFSTGLELGSTRSILKDFRCVRNIDNIPSEMDGSITNEIELPTNANIGDMSYWDGISWQLVEGGEEGAFFAV